MWVEMILDRIERISNLASVLINTLVKSKEIKQSSANGGMVIPSICISERDDLLAFDLFVNLEKLIHQERLINCKIN